MTDDRMLQIIYTESCCIICGEDLEWNEDSEEKQCAYCMECEVEHVLFKDTRYGWVFFAKVRKLHA